MRTGIVDGDGFETAGDVSAGTLGWVSVVSKAGRVLLRRCNDWHGESPMRRTLVAQLERGSIVKQLDLSSPAVPSSSSSSSSSRVTATALKSSTSTATALQIGDSSATAADRVWWISCGLLQTKDFFAFFTF